MAANAQQPEALPEPIRVEVTGSRIARIDGETALPVQVIGREEILRGNWTTAAELMAHVSANFNGANNALNIGQPLYAPGLSGADLRGLGPGNTLVLLNGRRIANYAFAGATVDLTTIPLAAIERVEILKDGASSIYGTDAIAGVVNFVTRKNFAGAEVTGQAGLTEQGGGDHYQATATAGWGDLTKDRFNAFITVDWQKDTALNASERPFAATGYRPEYGIGQLANSTFPANVRRPQTAATATRRLPAAACHRFRSRSVRRAASTLPTPPTCCRSRSNGTSSAARRGSGRPASRSSQSLSTPATRSKRAMRPRPPPGVAPSTVRRSCTRLVGPTTPPSLPQTIVSPAHWRSTFASCLWAPQTQTVTTDSQRYVIGAQGTVSAWIYNAGYTHSVNTADYGFASGFVATAPFQAAMASGLVNPFGDSGPAGLALLQSAQVTGTTRKATGTLDQLDFSMSRDIVVLPGGPLAIAIGGEGRREQLTDEPSQGLESGTILGLPLAVSPQDASRNVGAVYARSTCQS